MIAPYLQACNSIALCWIQKPSRCHINENYDQCLPQKNCITSWYHLNLKFVAKRQRTITEFRNLSAAQKKFRKVDRKSSRYFIHSKFARSETASYTTSTTCGCTIPVWWNSVKPPVTHWLKGDFEIAKPGVPAKRLGTTMEVSQKTYLYEKSQGFKSLLHSSPHRKPKNPI